MTTEKRDTRTRTGLMIGTALVTSMILVGAAQAQTAPAPQQDERSAQVDDIIVTAQKREQRLQDVPIAITAITSEVLEANRITNVTDLSGLVPNVQVRPAAGGSQVPAFSMRGAVSYGVVPGADKSVSIYLDGVYIGNPKGSIFDVPDVSRIEVLRGPQGTLFGRNATAGAVSVTTRDPDGEFGFRQEFTIGNYDQRRSRTSIDTPTWGPFSAYVSYVHNERRGDARNLGAGTVWDRTAPESGLGRQVSPQYLGDKDQDSFFAALRFEPNDRFSTVYKFDYTNDNYTPEATSFVGINTAAPLIGSFLNALLTSQTTPVIANTAMVRPDVVNNAYSVPGEQRNSGHNLTSTFQVSDSITIKNIASYRSSYLDTTTQLDGLGGLTFTSAALVPYATFVAFSTNPSLALAPPAVQGATIGAYAAGLAPLVGSRFLVVGANPQDEVDQWSDELQVNFDNDFVSLTAGALYFHQEGRSGSPIGLPGTSSFTPIPTTGRIPIGNQSVSYNEATSIAAYVQGDFHVTPQLDLVAGYRITNDKKSGRYEAGGVFVPATPGSVTAGTFTGIRVIPFVYEDDQPSYLIGANYKPNDDILIYGKYSRSFVSGGSVGGVGFDPEIAKGFEFGLKADFLERSLRTNLAVFHVDYENLQASASGINVGRPDLGTLVIQQGDSTAKGFELEVTYVPTDGLTLNGSFGYTDVEFGPVNPILQASVGAGRFLPTLIPDYTANLSAQYETAPIWGNAYLFFRTDAAWRSEQRTYSNPVQSAAIPIIGLIDHSDATWIVNARASIKDISLAGGTAELAIWARNLTDDDSATFPLGFSNFLVSSTFQRARTFGVDLIFDF